MEHFTNNFQEINSQGKVLRSFFFKDKLISWEQPLLAASGHRKPSPRYRNRLESNQSLQVDLRWIHIATAWAKQNWCKLPNVRKLVADPQIPQNSAASLNLRVISAESFVLFCYPTCNYSVIFKAQQKDNMKASANKFQHFCCWIPKIETQPTRFKQKWKYNSFNPSIRSRIEQVVISTQ